MVKNRFFTKRRGTAYSVNSTPTQRELWRKMLADLPSLPVGRTDANGKSPPTQTDAVTQSQNRRFRSVTFCCQQGGGTGR
jgi:hypothetical protein